MPDRQLASTDERLKTPRAAALAGILFAVLYSSRIVLIRLSVPPDVADHGVWLRDRAGSVALALNLVPFAGIAFLWFMGVVRDRIGFLEDQFFSTVFFGSGLLFLALTFYGGSSFQVARRLRAMLENLIASLPADRRPPLEVQLRMLERAVERDFPDAEDRESAAFADPRAWARVGLLRSLVGMSRPASGTGAPRTTFGTRPRNARAARSPSASRRP